MTQYWGSGKNPTFEQSVEASRRSKLDQYAKDISMYTGWVKNGKIFVLNKKEKFVSFLYEITRAGHSLDSKPKTISLRTHYNPRNVDCVEQHIWAKRFPIDASFKVSPMTNDEYEISTDEKKLIKQCDKLIGKMNNHK